MTDPELIRRCASCPINGAGANIRILGAVAEIMVLSPKGNEWVTTAQEMESEVGCLTVENDKLLARLALEGAHLSPEELVPARECATRLRYSTCDNFQITST